MLYSTDQDEYSSCFFDDIDNPLSGVPVGVGVRGIDFGKDNK